MITTKSVAEMKKEMNDLVWLKENVPSFSSELDTKINTLKQEIQKIQREVKSN